MPREFIVIVCTECKRRNYTSTKNKKKQTYAFLLAAKERGPEALKDAWAKVKAEVQAEYDKQKAVGKNPAGKKKPKK